MSASGGISFAYLYDNNEPHIRKIEWRRPDGTVLWEMLYNTGMWICRPEPSNTYLDTPIEGPYEIVDRPVDWPVMRP